MCLPTTRGPSAGRVLRPGRRPLFQSVPAERTGLGFCPHADPGAAWPAEETREAGLNADSSSSACKFVSIQVLPPSKLLPLKVNRWRRPFLPLSFPFPLPQLKPGWKALAGLPDYSTLSKGRSLRVAPPAIWLAGPPPFPYLARGPHPSAGAAAAAGCRQLEGGHGSGYRAGTCSVKRARGRVLGFLGDNSGTLQPRRRKGIEGGGWTSIQTPWLTDLDAKVQPKAYTALEAKEPKTGDDPGIEGRQAHRPGPGGVRARAVGRERAQGGA